GSKRTLVSVWPPTSRRESESGCDGRSKALACAAAVPPRDRSANAAVSTGRSLSPRPGCRVSRVPRDLISGPSGVAPQGTSLVTLYPVAVVLAMPIAVAYVQSVLPRIRVSPWWQSVAVLRNGSCCCLDT